MRIRILFWLILGTAINGFSQDVNFMMYSNTDLNINPAIISTSDDFKFTGSYLNKTYVNNIHAQSAFLMISRPLYRDSKRFGGFGFSILSDKSGDVNQLSMDGLTVAYAHEIQLTSWSRISMGLQAGYFLKRLGTQNFSTGSQWLDGVGYDPSVNNGEAFSKESVGNFTLSSGLFWYIPSVNHTVKSYLGFAMYNLTKPNYSFFNTNNPEPFKYIVSAGHEVYRNDYLSIIPHALYYNSYFQDNWNIGVKWSYRYKVQKESWLFSSGSIDLLSDYKINEGLMLGLQVNQPQYSFAIGYGFSDNFSSEYVPGKNTVEISVTIKKSLYREPRKQKVVADDNYYNGQERELVFKTPEKEISKGQNIIEKEKVNDVKKEIKRESNKEIKFKLEKDFQFGFNAAVLNEEAKVYINDIVILLSENEMLNIEIIGHTDNVGSKSANQKISEQRAEIVKEYLIEKGVDERRIKTKGMADSKPLNENDTDENRAKNRRVEFVIYY